MVLARIAAVGWIGSGQGWAQVPDFSTKTGDLIFIRRKVMQGKVQKQAGTYVIRGEESVKHKLNSGDVNVPKWSVSS
ncbi:hypothetical protein DV515_00011225 [Chloebia gouldiae]|uniref:Uncharacterized protein n=1 Tax=Chloebia gouldiae TaxID=44316 RepID=A0A3L8S848_CHLGU|nr:hypothetical protein DV515_00011225 [Chloebia gouldiae]